MRVMASKTSGGTSEDACPVGWRAKRAMTSIESGECGVW